MFTTDYSTGELNPFKLRRMSISSQVVDVIAEPVELTDAR
jgi:hypothetical protein